MARWLLREPHYLNSPDTFWEQQMTDRETGRQKRVQYPVPLHLDPNNPADWNYKSGGAHITQGGNAFTEGGIVVCYKGKGELKDIIFEGAPTPGMEPIDDEAKELTAKLSHKLGYDVFALAGDENATYSNHILNKAADLFSEAQSKTSEVSAELVSAQKETRDIMATMAQVLAQNAALLKELTSPRRGI